MKKCGVSVLLVMMSISLFAQLQGSENKVSDSLRLNLQNSKTAAEKVKWLGVLSQYYMGIDKSVSDKYWTEQSNTAEMSRDRKLMIDALFTNARRHLNMAGRLDYLHVATAYSEKALVLSKASNMNEYEAWAYILLAQSALANGKTDPALNYSNLAESIASGSDNDSLKISSALQLGNTYLYKNERMLAFRSYLRGTNLAEEMKNFDLQETCYYALSQFYSGLNDYEQAKDYLYKIIALTKKYNKPYDRLNAYNTMGSIYSRNNQQEHAISFFEQALALADTLNFQLIKLNTYGAMWNTYLSHDKAKEALDFLNTQPELKRFLKQSGYDYYIDQTNGMAYAEIGKLDSAAIFLAKAEKGIEQNANIYSRHSFYMGMAYFSTLRKDYKTALAYALKGKGIADATGSMELQAKDAQKLDSIYQILGDFKNSYFYNRQYQKATDSLEKITLDKELALAEVENENKRAQREEALAAEAQRERHNIQYMGITVAIAGVFIVLVMLGIFSVSQTTIRVLGFFAFIFLFEFVILLADNKIHHWTHGEPWKVLLIKIGLISILLPLHHYTEKKVIHYITSRKMFELNRESFFSRLKKKAEAPTPD
jgi:hypothetical protein